MTQTNETIFVPWPRAFPVLIRKKFAHGLSLIGALARVSATIFSCTLILIAESRRKKG